MKKILLIFLSISLFTISCSKDDNGGGTDESSIEGTWDATELRIDESNASDEEEFGRDILDFLTAKDCYIVTFTFNSDATLLVEDSVNYLEINQNSDGSGIDIPCPTESDTNSTSYTYQGQVLTFIDSNGQTVNANVEINGNIMVIDASSLNIPNFNTGGELIFRKR